MQQESTGRTERICRLGSGMSKEHTVQVLSQGLSCCACFLVRSNGLAAARVCIGLAACLRFEWRRHAVCTAGFCAAG
jgi:hypothetical protein